MRTASIALLFAVSCFSTVTTAEQHSYTPRLGNFQCKDYPLGVTVEEALGPHGGTIRIRDPIREIRFDLEEFKPALDKATLESMRPALYEGYLKQNTMPMLRKVSADAELLEAKALILDTPRSLAGLPVYQSAVAMAKKGIVRGQIQYSDGRFIYTMSNLIYIKEDWSKEKQAQAAYEQLLKGLAWCQFDPTYK